MYSKEFRESLNAVEAAREANIALEPARMTAEEKEKLLKQYHPDYKTSEFAVLKVGANSGEEVPHELCEMLQAHSRINPCEIDLGKIDYDVDVLVIGAIQGTSFWISRSSLLARRRRGSVGSD